eukprot:Nk52_evm9s155 gene=Nk52_evmTU9s155
MHRSLIHPRTEYGKSTHNISNIIGEYAYEKFVKQNACLQSTNLLAKSYTNQLAKIRQIPKDPKLVWYLSVTRPHVYKRVETNPRLSVRPFIVVIFEIEAYSNSFFRLKRPVFFSKLFDEFPTGEELLHCLCTAILNPIKVYPELKSDEVVKLKRRKSLKPAALWYDKYATINHLQMERLSMCFGSGLHTKYFGNYNIAKALSKYLEKLNFCQDRRPSMVKFNSVEDVRAFYAACVKLYELKPWRYISHDMKWSAKVLAHKSVKIFQVVGGNKNCVPGLIFFSSFRVMKSYYSTYTTDSSLEVTKLSFRHVDDILYTDAHSIEKYEFPIASYKAYPHLHLLAKKYDSESRKYMPYELNQRPKGEEVVVLTMIIEGLCALLSERRQMGSNGRKFTPLDFPRIFPVKTAKGSVRVTISCPPYIQKRECSVCGKSAASVCSRCRTALYCSSSCQTSDHQEHRSHCKTMRLYTMRSDQVFDLPFPWINESTAEVHDKSIDIDSFLSEMDVFDKGIWKCERTKYLSIKEYPPGSIGIRIDTSEYYLKEREYPKDVIRNDLQGTLNSWSSYYSVKNISLASPVAIVLHWAMTIYRILTKYCMPMKIISKREKIVLHILGPHRELDYFITFKEIMNLLPGFHIELNFIGPEITSSMHGGHVDFGDVKSNSILQIRLFRAKYHTFFKTKYWTPPTCIIAMHPKLKDHHSWMQTLDIIDEYEFPTFFTEANEYDALHDMEFITSLNIENNGCWVLNPFRQPVAYCDPCLKLPGCKNGFIFGLYIPQFPEEELFGAVSKTNEAQGTISASASAEATSKQ